jgi:hypothetical protein
MTRLPAATLLLSACLASSLHAQSITSEAAITTGATTEERTAAAAMQVRLFGDAVAGISYFSEVAWASRSGTRAEMDAFGAAYPYGNRVQMIEAYGERMFRPRGAVFGVKAGRYRTPFGISNGSDYAYSGFLRAPLMRYDGYFALSNDFLEHGVDVIAGVPRFTIEASAGVPADVGDAHRRSGADAVVRAQSALGPFIVGASYIRTEPYQPAAFAEGSAGFGGVDVRWMRGGVQVRGEWLSGHPFNGTSTMAWYTDVMVHHLGMGPVTAVARIERIAYDAIAPFGLQAQRQTIGTRIRLLNQLALQVDLLHQSGQIASPDAVPLDVGITYTIRRH